MRYSLTKENRLNISYRYLYDGGNLIRIEKGSGTSLQYIDFLYDGVMLCGFRFGDLYTSYHRIYYYLYGHGGNVEGILDAGGNLLVRYTYDAWGNFTESVKTSNSGALAALALNPFRYRGYVYDFETGFYYLQSRYYDPETGRFILADSYVSTGQGFVGNNMFAYCLNDPIDYSDNFGSRAVPCTRFVTGGYPNPFTSDGKGKSDDLLQKIVPLMSDLQNKQNFNLCVMNYGRYLKTETKDAGDWANITMSVMISLIPWGKISKIADVVFKTASTGAAFADLMGWGISDSIANGYYDCYIVKLSWTEVYEWDGGTTYEYFDYVFMVFWDTISCEKPKWTPYQGFNLSQTEVILN